MRAAAIRTLRYVRHAGWKLVRLNKATIFDALYRFGKLRSNILTVHGSLSACGYIKGGPRTVVEALREWISDQALVMPTHTFCYPDKNGITPIYDGRSTPSVVGAITDYFWRQPAVIRSSHPTHSLAASGPGSEELCQKHELCETPCGAGTPYERLVEQDCSVLMFGATMNTYTLFHTAEDKAQVPYLYEREPYNLRFRDQDGTVRSIVMRRQDMHVTRRFGEMDTWLEEQGLLKRRRLGWGELLFIPHAGDLHERVVKELRQDPLFLVADEARTDLLKFLAL